MRIELQHVSYIYSRDSAFEVKAVDDVSFTVGDNELIGIIGQTGSGKSTLIKHLNGLIAPTEGRVLVNGEDIHADKYDLRALRTRVGLVFQYPENQLFETDILTDAAFGPKNRGCTDAEAKERAAHALRQVGISEELFSVSPFELSGGQKRRVAIAGVLAMEPEVLILDEPTAGLDPRGRDEIFSELERLHAERGISVLLVSHSMENVARFAKRVLVMQKGKLVYDDTPKAVFSHAAELEAMGLAVPELSYLLRDLQAGGMAVDPSALTIEESVRTILAALPAARKGDARA